MRDESASVEATPTSAIQMLPLRKPRKVCKSVDKCGPLPTCPNAVANVALVQQWRSIKVEPVSPRDLQVSK